jgi:arsenate reductase-like glutaredoxin family protein
MTIDNELINQIKITPLLETLKLEDISDEKYFSEYKKDYISNSRLGVLKKDGVKAFFEGIPQTYNPSFVLGSLIHEQVLQPESFEVVEGIFKPTAKAGLMADALYKSDGTLPTDDEIKSMSYVIGYYKDKLTKNRLLEFKQKSETYWRDRFIFEQKNPFKEGDRKRVYTDEKNFEILQGCLNSLNNNQEIQKLLHPEGLVEKPIVMNEHTILMDIKMEAPNEEARVYKLKAKLDNFTIDSEENVITVNDLKTCGKPLDMFNPEYYSYQREISFYSYLLKLCAKKFYNMDNPTIKGNFLTVSTIPEYDSCVYPMTPKLFKSGWEEVKYLLKVVYIMNVKYGYEFR